MALLDVALLGEDASAAQHLAVVDAAAFVVDEGAGEAAVSGGGSHAAMECSERAGAEAAWEAARGQVVGSLVPVRVGSADLTRIYCASL